MIFSFILLIIIIFSQTHINYELDINLSSNNQIISSESSFSSNSIMDIRNLNNEFH